MTQYSTGIATKNRILETCKDLFYHKGYTETTFNDICKEAKVNRGSIVYHLEGKKYIAAQIYSDLIAFIIKKILELFGDEDELVLLLLYLAVHHRLLFDDALYRRYLIQFSSEYFTLSNLAQYKKDFLAAYSYTVKKMGQKKADFYFAGYVSMGVGLELYIDQNIDSFTFEEVVRATSEMYFLFVSSEELEKKIERVLDLMKTVEIRNQVFDVTIDLK